MVMKKKGHIILGFITNALLIYLLTYLGFSLFEINFKTILILSCIIAFYSILPDIDHKNSTITWFFFGTGLLGLIFGIIELVFGIKNPNPIIVLVISTLLLVFTFVSGNFLKHRGLVHTIQMGLIACLPIYLLFNNIVFALIAYFSWHSHLIGDGLWFKTKA